MAGQSGGAAATGVGSRLPGATGSRRYCGAGPVATGRAGSQDHSDQLPA